MNLTGVHTTPRDKSWCWGAGLVAPTQGFVSLLCTSQRSFQYDPMLQTYCACFFPLTLLPTKNHHLSPAATRIKSLVTAVADLQHTLKEIQGRDQEWGPLCSEKTAKAGLQIDILRRRLENLFNLLNFLHLLMSRKALELLMGTSALHD